MMNCATLRDTGYTCLPALKTLASHCHTPIIFALITCTSQQCWSICFVKNVASCLSLAALLVFVILILRCSRTAFVLLCVMLTEYICHQVHIIVFLSEANLVTLVFSKISFEILDEFTIADYCSSTKLNPPF